MIHAIMKTMRNISVIGVLFCLCSLSSCYNYRNTGLLQEKNKNLPVYEQTEYTPYKIRVNDELIYRLITKDETLAKVISSGSVGNLNYTTSYRVNSDGTVDFPFLDSVEVAGKTIPEAESEVCRRYKELIPDAEVKLALGNKTFTVIGDIGSGVFSVYKDKLTIFQALAMSGDLSLSGDRKHVRIIRERNGKPEILEFDIRPNSIIESKYYYVYPNDVIYVQRSKGSFYKMNTYSSFIGLITSSLSLLITVLYYIK